MKEEITAILRLASERGLPSLLIGGNAIILLGHIRNLRYGGEDALAKIKSFQQR